MNIYTDLWYWQFWVGKKCCKSLRHGRWPVWKWLSRDQAIYSRTVVRQLSYVRRSCDIDTTPFAIHDTWRTYYWRKYERKSATYLPLSYDRHRRPFYWLLSTLICIKSLLIRIINQKLHIHVCVKVYVTYLGK